MKTIVSLKTTKWRVFNKNTRIEINMGWENWTPIQVASLYQIITDNDVPNEISARSIVALFLPAHHHYITAEQCLSIQQPFCQFWQELPTKIPFTTFEANEQNWALPLYGFDSLSYLEFSEAMANLIAYQHTQNTDYLLGFVAVLVRPQSPEYDPNSPQTAHLPQQPYNYALHKQNQQRIQQWPPMLFMYLLNRLVAETCRFLGQKDLAPLFKKTNDGLPSPAIYQQIAEAATALPNFQGGITQINQLPAAHVLRILANQKK